MKVKLTNFLCDNLSILNYEAESKFLGQDLVHKH